jgi:prolyl oligopeptidase PreP (S9A serine peptidase family)
MALDLPTAVAVAVVVLSGLWWILMGPSKSFRNEDEVNLKADPKSSRASRWECGDLADEKENFRWLERGDSVETGVWVDRQRRAFDVYRVRHLATHATRSFSRRYRALVRASGHVQQPFVRGNYLFYLARHNFNSNYPYSLYCVDQTTGLTRILVDARRLLPHVLQSVWVNDDGHMCAYSFFEEESSQQREVRALDVPSGDEYTDALTASDFGAVAWSQRCLGFFYSSRVRRRLYEHTNGGYKDIVESTDECIVYFHRLGLHQDLDVAVYGCSGDRRGVSPHLHSCRLSHDEQHLLVETFESSEAPGNAVRAVDISKFDGRTRESVQSIVPLVPQLTHRYTYICNKGNDFWFLTTQGAPKGRVVRLSLLACARSTASSPPSSSPSPALKGALKRAGSSLELTGRVDLNDTEILVSGDGVTSAGLGVGVGASLDRVQHRLTEIEPVLEEWVVEDGVALLEEVHMLGEDILLLKYFRNGSHELVVVDLYDRSVAGDREGARPRERGQRNGNDSGSGSIVRYAPPALSKSVLVPLGFDGSFSSFHAGAGAPDVILQIATFSAPPRTLRVAVTRAPTGELDHTLSDVFEWDGSVEVEPDSASDSETEKEPPIRVQACAQAGSEADVEEKASPLTATASPSSPSSPRPVQGKVSINPAVSEATSTPITKINSSKTGCRLSTMRLLMSAEDDMLVPVSIFGCVDFKGDVRSRRPRPCILVAHGGFGCSMVPSYSPSHVAFAQEVGGIVCVVNNRGGGEFGAEWHNLGRHANKQMSVSDVIWAAEFLIQEGFTTSALLGLHGFGAGGTLVGACTNQRPELFSAVVVERGILDLLHFDELSPPRRSRTDMTFRLLTPLMGMLGERRFAVQEGVKRFLVSVTAHVYALRMVFETAFGGSEHLTSAGTPQSAGTRKLMRQMSGERHSLAGAAKHTSRLWPGQNSASSTPFPFTSVESLSHGDSTSASSVNSSPSGVQYQPQLRRLPVGGAWDSWYYEFGFPNHIVSDYNHLRLLSPVHNVTSMTPYPAILLVTDEYDDDIPPQHSYKMAANVQHMQESTVHKPTLVLIGHTSVNMRDHAANTEATTIDVFAFFIRHLVPSQQRSR